jgi:hypothetical protein
MGGEDEEADFGLRERLKLSGDYLASGHDLFLNPK